MGKKKDQATNSPSKRPTPPSAPLEVEGTPVEDRSAKGKRRSDGAAASPSAPKHQHAKEASAEPKGKQQKKEKKEKRARKEKVETPAAEAEGHHVDGEKKEKKHKKSKAAQESTSIAASLPGYAAGDLSKSLFGGESAAVEPAALFSAIPEAPPYPTMESSDEDEDDSGSDGARNNEDAEVLKLRREEEEEREEKHNREKLGRTVFVGNVPVETDRKELQKLFKAYGEVESVRLRSVALAKESLLSYRKAGVLSKQFHPSRSTCNAYVVFTARDMAEEALALNNHLLDGRHLHVDLADSTNKYAEADNSIFVGNLPFDAEEEDVRAHFASCGDIEYVRLVRDKETNIGKGIGYVNFKDRDGVAAALLMHGHQYKNRELRVFAAKSRKVEQRRAPRGGRGGRGGSSPGRGRGGAPSRGGERGRGGFRGGERGRGGFRGGRGGGDVAERSGSRGGDSEERGGSRGADSEERGGFRGGRGGDSEGRVGRGGFRGRGGERGGRGGFRGGLRGGDRGGRGGFRGGFRGGDRGGRGGFGGGERGGFGGGERGGFRGGFRGSRGGERGGRGGFRGGRGGAGGAGFSGPERRIAKEPREPAVARRREAGESFEGKRSEPGVVPRLKRPTKDPHKAAGPKKRAPKGK